MDVEFQLVDEIWFFKKKYHLRIIVTLTAEQKYKAKWLGILDVDVVEKGEFHPDRFAIPFKEFVDTGRAATPVDSPAVGLAAQQTILGRLKTIKDALDAPVSEDGRTVYKL